MAAWTFESTLIVSMGRGDITFQVAEYPWLPGATALVFWECSSPGVGLFEDGQIQIIGDRPPLALSFSNAASCRVLIGALERVAERLDAVERSRLGETGILDPTEETEVAPRLDQTIPADQIRSD